MTDDLLQQLQRRIETLEARLAEKERGEEGPHYDSGWFAVVASQTYNKAHGLPAAPSRIICLVRAGSTYEWAGYRFIDSVGVSSGIDWDRDATNVIVRTKSDLDGNATTGDVRILAWL